MKEIRTVWGQTLFDVAIQEYGHTNGVFLLIEDNPNLIGEWGDVPQPGTKVLVRLEVPELSDDNRAVAAEFARREKLVVSGFETNHSPENDLYVNTNYWQENYVN